VFSFDQSVSHMQGGDRASTAIPKQVADVAKRAPRKVSDAAAKKGERLLRKLPIVKDQGQNNIQESQRHLLNLIEVLMNELQKLRTTLSEEKRQHKILTDYIIAAQDINRTEIMGLTEKLNAERAYQYQLREKIAQIVANTLADSEQNPAAGILLKHLEQLFQDIPAPMEPSLSEDFLNFPTFGEWLEKAKEEIPLDVDLGIDTTLAIAEEACVGVC
jgi:hypothetical protein